MTRKDINNNININIRTDTKKIKKRRKSKNNKRKSKKYIQQFGDGKQYTTGVITGGVGAYQQPAPDYKKYAENYHVEPKRKEPLMIEPPKEKLRIEAPKEKLRIETPPIEKELPKEKKKIRFHSIRVPPVKIEKDGLMKVKTLKDLKSIMIASYPSALKTEKRKQLKSFTRVNQKENVIDYFLDDIKKLSQPIISETPPSVEVPSEPTKRVFTRPRITRLSLNETPPKQPTMQFEDQTPSSDNNIFKLLNDLNDEVENTPIPRRLPILRMETSTPFSEEFLKFINEEEDEKIEKTPFKLPSSSSRLVSLQGFTDQNAMSGGGSTYPIQLEEDSMMKLDEPINQEATTFAEEKEPPKKSKSKSKSTIPVKTGRKKKS
jgi:hypothetical protein